MSIYDRTSDKTEIRKKRKIDLFLIISTERYSKQKQSSTYDKVIQTWHGQIGHKYYTNTTHYLFQDSVCAFAISVDL